MCKGSAVHQPTRPSDLSRTADVLAGWFHPAAVDHAMQWSSSHVTELQEQAVPPISQQELRL
jgi:hypothetical protein